MKWLLYAALAGVVAAHNHTNGSNTSTTTGAVTTTAAVVTTTAAATTTGSANATQAMTMKVALSGTMTLAGNMTHTTLAACATAEIAAPGSCTSATDALYLKASKQGLVYTVLNNTDLTMADVQSTAFTAFTAAASRRLDARQLTATAGAVVTVTADVEMEFKPTVAATKIWAASEFVGGSGFSAAFATNFASALQNDADLAALKALCMNGATNVCVPTVTAVVTMSQGGVTVTQTPTTAAPSSDSSNAMLKFAVSPLLALLMLAKF